MEFSVNARMAEYYEKFIELQEKLRKSEEDRLKLEMKFSEMVQKSREEEQVYYRRLRSQYKKFLEEDRKRQERNEKIVRTLERIETRIDMLTSKTERFKSLRKYYHNYLQRVSGQQAPKTVVDTPRYNLLPKEQPFSHGTLPPSEDICDKDQQKINDEKMEILDRYLESISSQNCRDLIEQKKAQNAELEKLDALQHRLNNGFDSNKAQSIAEDIMNSIYNRHYNKDYSQEERYTSSDSRKPNIRFTCDDDDEKSDFSDLPQSKDALQYPNLPKSETTEYGRNITKLDKDFSNYINGKDNDQPNKIENDVKEKEKRMFVEDTHELRYIPKPSEMDHFENSDDDIRNENVLKEKCVQDVINSEKDFNQRSSHKFQKVPFTNETDEFVEVKKFDNVINDEDGQISKYDQPVKDGKVKLSNEKPHENENLETLKEIPDTIISPLNDLDNESVHHITGAEVLSQNESPVERFVEHDTINDSNVELSEPVGQKEQTNIRAQEELVENQPHVQYDNGQDMHDGENEQPPVQYDENGQVVQYDQTEQPVQYDESGQPIQYDTSGQVVQYDENGQPIQYDENSQPIQYDENNQDFQYDNHGQQIQYDESGQVIQYDENGQPIQYDQNGQSIQYDQNGQPIQYDQNGQPMQYDENGQLIQNPQAVVQYDENGQPIYFDQSGQQIQYDENGQIIQYDENGQIIQYDENGQPIQYDENGQPIYQYQQYDESGQPIQQYDENGQPIQYDESGQPIQYDADGQLIQNYTDESQQNKNIKINAENNFGEPVLPENPSESALPENPSEPALSANPSEPVLPENSSGATQENNAENNQNKSKVLEMLDTDTESLQQNVSKVSDSDFSISQ